MIPCYVAAAFRGPTAWAIAENVRAAERVHLAACRLGFASVCPHTNTAHFQGECSDAFWLEMTLSLMRLVHAGGGPLICLPFAWAKSSGTRGELHEAQRIGMPCFEALEISDDPKTLRLASMIAYSGRETWSSGVGDVAGETLGEWMGRRPLQIAEFPSCGAMWIHILGTSGGKSDVPHSSSLPEAPRIPPSGGGGGFGCWILVPGVAIRSTRSRLRSA